MATEAPSSSATVHVFESQLKTVTVAAASTSWTKGNSNINRLAVKEPSVKHSHPNAELQFAPIDSIGRGKSAAEITLVVDTTAAIVELTKNQ